MTWSEIPKSVRFLISSLFDLPVIYLLALLMISFLITSAPALFLFPIFSPLFLIIPPFFILLLATAKTFNSTAMMWGGFIYLHTFVWWILVCDQFWAKRSKRQIVIRMQNFTVIHQVAPDCWRFTHIHTNPLTHPHIQTDMLFLFLFPSVLMMFPPKQFVSVIFVVVCLVYCPDSGNESLLKWILDHNQS